MNGIPSEHQFQEAIRELRLHNMSMKHVQQLDDVRAVKISVPNSVRASLNAISKETTQEPGFTRSMH